MELRNHQAVTSNQSMNISQGIVHNWLKWPELGSWRNGSGWWKVSIGWIFFLPRIPFLLLIKIYQMTFSPDHGPFKSMFPNGYCRFHPTCSVYGYESLKKYGLIRGIPMTIWRIIRCNPWNDGGEDEP
jgi:putative membrane protein insertion efficiency factor